MTVDWSRAIVEKTTVGKKKAERIVYKDEKNSCSKCRFYIQPTGKKTKSECERKFPIGSYSKACVMFVEVEK